MLIRSHHKKSESNRIKLNCATQGCFHFVCAYLLFCFFATCYFVLRILIFFEMLLPREAAMLERSWDRNSVCPSVTRVLSDETKEHIADILIPHEKVIN